MTKRCCRCKQDLPTDRFSRDRSNTDGLQYACKACATLKSQEWRQRHPDAERAYRQKTLEQARARKKRRYHADLEASRAAIRVRVAAYDARKRGVYVEDVHPLIVLERDDGVCGICDTDVDPFDFHVDHVIPLARGGAHSYANVQAAHPDCNRRKWAHIGPLDPNSPSPGVIGR